LKLEAEQNEEPDDTVWRENNKTTSVGSTSAKVQSGSGEVAITTDAGKLEKRVRSCSKHAAVGGTPHPMLL
jgi:hypothetical protein